MQIMLKCLQNSDICKSVTLIKSWTTDAQLIFTCSNSTTETEEKGVKYVKSY